MALPERIPGEMVTGPEISLIQKLRDDDVAAFDGLVREHWPRLVYYLLDRVRVRELAEDLAQDAFARLWQRRRKLDPTGSALSYLYQIARNLAVDELRKLQVRRRFRERELFEEADPAITPLQLVEDREALQAMQRALERMPERRRESFMLVRVQKLSIREAAEVMGTATQTIANQVSAALADLRQSMKEHLQ